MTDATPVRADAVYVIGAGAQTPVGRGVLAAAGAVRAGVTAFAEHPFMLDRHGEPLVVAGAEWLGEDLDAPARVAALAGQAAREALVALGDPPTAHVSAGRLGCYLALSADTLRGDGAHTAVARAVAAVAGLADLADEVELVVDGHAGALLALESAVAALRAGTADACLVGGADSWLDPSTLDALDGANRLHSLHQRWGFTPGEGAGFCLVATGALVRARELTPVAELLAVATANETQLMGTPTVCVGGGLTDAFRGVLEPEGTGPSVWAARGAVARAYGDLNGETYRAEEYGFTASRVGEHFVDPGRVTAGAASWGDVGAASGALALGLPLAGWARGYADGPVALAWASSATGPLRGAALLRQVTV